MADMQVNQVQSHKSCPHRFNVDVGFVLHLQLSLGGAGHGAEGLGATGGSLVHGRGFRRRSWWRDGVESHVDGAEERVQSRGHLLNRRRQQWRDHLMLVGDGAHLGFWKTRWWSWYPMRRRFTADSYLLNTRYLLSPEWCYLHSPLSLRGLLVL